MARKRRRARRVAPAPQACHTALKSCLAGARSRKARGTCLGKFSKCRNK